MKNRDSSLDFLKGISIVLMVLGHAVTNWAEGKWILSFIGLFHMPVFFMAAGYVFKAKRDAFLWTAGILHGGIPRIVSRVGLDATLHNRGCRIANQLPS